MNIHFAKKHKKKDLKLVQVHSVNLVKPKEVKPTIPKNDNHTLSQLAYVAHSKRGKRASASLPRVSGSAGQHPRPRLKASLRLWLQLQLRLLKVPKSLRRLQSQWRPLSASVRMERLEGPLGFCLHGAGALPCFVQINLRQDLSKKRITAKTSQCSL